MLPCPKAPTPAWGIASPAAGQPAAILGVQEGLHRRVWGTTQGLPLLWPQEDAEDEEEGAQQSLPGEGLDAQQGSIQAAVGQVGARAGGRLCLQGGDWNSLKQLFNERSGCQESPVQTHAPP